MPSGSDEIAADPRTLGGSTEIVMVTDRDGFIEFVNQGFEEASGYAGLEVIGRKPSFLKSGRHGIATYRRLWATIAQGHVYRGELINRRKDGGLFRESKTIFPVADGQGSIAKYVAVGAKLVDQSERHDNSRHTVDLRLLADVVPGIIYKTSLNGRAEMHIFGECIDRMTGFSGEELSRNVECPLRMLMSEGDLERRRIEMSRAAADGRSFTVEYAICRRDGTIGQVLECGRSTLPTDAASSGAYGLILDVSERRSLEQKLQASEQARSALFEELHSALESDRKRIARELHDDIGQILASIKMRVESAIALSARNDMSAAQELLAGVVPSISSAIDEVRRICLDLRPPMIDDLGIVATIGWLCREFSAICGSMRVEFDLRVDERDVPEPLKIVIYRVLQEAMNNIAAHADARVARVRLLRTTRGLELVIEDDGCGFDPSQVRERKPGIRGSGLASMRERIESAGGGFSLETIKGAGTVVRAIFPLRH